MIITFRHTEAPRMGHYFKAPKGRNAYHIVGVRQVGRVGLGGTMMFKCTVEKISAVHLPADADVVTICWDKRGRKRT